MVKRGKIHICGMALFQALPLLFCLLLPDTVGGRAEAAPAGVAREAVRLAAVVPPTVPALAENGPYESGMAALDVSTIPAGAELFLDDRLLGVTPWSGSGLPAGRFLLRLRLPDHQPVEDQVELVAGSTVNKSHTLVPLRGSLAVLTSPPGARVYLDGLEQKGRTPLDITGVTAGSHLVRVHLDRYQDAEQKVAVAADWGNRVKFDLKGGHLEACGEKWLEPEAAARCRAEEEARKQTVLFGEFVQVVGGCFQMGDTLGGGWSDEKPVHEVCLDGFAIGKYEVTQGQWQAVMGKNPSYFKKGDDFPVEQVSWTEAQNFITRLNALTGRNFRMPSEAEWEYAARGGGPGKFAGGDNPEALAWYDKNSGASTHAVGTRQPNGLGIYDMSGNVGEWVQDWYDSEYYKISPRSNPVGPLGGCYGRVIRGGGWNIDAGLARVANRDRYEPSNRFAAIGFRLAYSLK